MGVGRQMFLGPWMAFQCVRDLVLEYTVSVEHWGSILIRYVSAQADFACNKPYVDVTLKSGSNFVRCVEIHETFHLAIDGAVYNAPSSQTRSGLRKISFYCRQI
jgi:hypothetical protein